MKLAFQKSKGGTPAAWWINLLTGNGGYSHCELVFYGGLALTATDTEGTVLRHRDYPAGQWSIFDLKMYERETEITSWAQPELGSPYDTGGVLRFIVPFLQQSPKAWFCSEICVAALQRVNVFDDLVSWKTTPNALLKATIKAGFKQIQ